MSGDFVPYDLDSQRLAYSARYFEDVVTLDAFESDLDVLRDWQELILGHCFRRLQKR